MDLMNREIRESQTFIIGLAYFVVPFMIGLSYIVKVFFIDDCYAFEGCDIKKPLSVLQGCIVV